MYLATQDTIDFAINGMPHSFGEGLYFGLAEDVYHRIPALSSTSMKNIQVSPPDFYFNSELNPLRAEDAEDEDAKEWRIFGRAAHTRVLEGREVFDSLYCVEFLPPEGCLDTVAQLKDFLKSYDIKGKSDWKKADYIAEVRRVNPEAMILDVEQQKYAQQMGGRRQLSARDIRRIEIAAAMIERHPELKYCFNGGYAEVSVVWKNEGVWFKARFDYLKPQAIVDLKSFTNKRNKPIDSALYEAMAGLKYHIQVCHYTDAAKKAVEFAQKNMVTTYGVQRFGPSPDFLRLLAEAQSHEFYFVFQKKGGAPLARGKRFRASLGMMQCARASIEQAVALFLQYYKTFGTGVWVDSTPITDFEDSLFPVWATEI